MFSCSLNQSWLRAIAFGYLIGSVVTVVWREVKFSFLRQRRGQESHVVMVTRRGSSSNYFSLVPQSRRVYSANRSSFRNGYADIEWLENGIPTSFNKTVGFACGGLLLQIPLIEENSYLRTLGTHVTGACALPSTSSSFLLRYKPQYLDDSGLFLILECTFIHVS